MNKIVLCFLAVSFLVSCATIRKNNGLNDNQMINQEVLDQAELNSPRGARRILEVGREMIANQDVIIGGCWDYINNVYTTAGYPSSRTTTVFKSKFNGPYFNTADVRPGDWLYYVNHTYSDTEHSAIFVAWTDENKKVALMMSYVGEKRKVPATYKLFTLDKIYNVFRARE